MRDWQAFVRARLALPALTPDREVRIVREIATQLEDFYRDAIAGGATEAEADAHAQAQIREWDRLAEDVVRADRAHARPPLERLTNHIDRVAAHEARPAASRGVLKMLADLIRDMRYAARQLIKSPGFAIVAILTLALGIGASSAMFSVVNGVLLRPLPYPDPGSLVRVHEVVPQYGRFSVAPANFLDWRQQNGVFASVAAYSGGTATFVGSEGPERIPNAAVSWNLFDVLGVSPALGRGFRQDEDAPLKNDVIVISHGMWQRRFGSDPSVLGRAVTIGGTAVTVVGVMPAGFYFPSRLAEFWTPLALNPANASRGGHYLAVVARLKPGVSVMQAGVEMKTIAERLARQYPDASANESAEIVRLHDQVVGPIRPALLTLLAAVGALILIACANVANLLLVRASIRQKEMAIRTALGAGRRRLVLQMLAESLVLALAGGALGLLLAYYAIPPIKTLSAGAIPRVDDISLDGRVLGFALLISIVTGIVFGLVPAWQASRGGVGEVLKEGGRSSSTSGGRWMRSGLLVAEVALSLVLLVGAVLLIRSFARLTGVDPGFTADSVLAFRLATPNATYTEGPKRIAFYDAMVARLESLPQIAAVGMIQALPLRGDYVLSFTIPGRAPQKPGEGTSANHRSVSPHYFQALGIPLKRGRLFTDRDSAKAPMVALVDEAFVRRHFPNEDPIGHGLDIGNGTDGAYEIVGVVGDVHNDSLSAAASPTMYVPFAQDDFSSMWMLARAKGDPAQVAGAVRAAVRELDASLPVFSMAPLATIVEASVAQQRFSMLLIGVFAAFALFLAAVGLYGVVSYTVRQRTQEIGLRMAIGADRGDVLRLVVGGGMKLAAVGVAIGLVAALGLSQLVATMLFQVTPFDPASYGATAAALLAVAWCACYVPARRAMRVDPLVALRQE